MNFFVFFCQSFRTKKRLLNSPNDLKIILLVVYAINTKDFVVLNIVFNMMFQIRNCIFIKRVKHILRHILIWIYVLKISMNNVYYCLL